MRIKKYLLIIGTVVILTSWMTIGCSNKGNIVDEKGGNGKDVVIEKEEEKDVVIEKENFGVKFKGEDISFTKEGGLVEIPLESKDKEIVHIITDFGEFQGTIVNNKLKFIGEFQDSLYDITDVGEVVENNVKITKSDIEENKEGYGYTPKNKDILRSFSMYYKNNYIEPEFENDSFVFKITDEMYNNLDEVEYREWTLESIL